MKLIVFQILVLIFAALFAAFLAMARRRGKNLFREAKTCEESGRWREACFAYAAAAYQGVRAGECRERIRALWQDHGPFEFFGLAGDGEARDGYSRGEIDVIVREIDRIVRNR